MAGLVAWNALPGSSGQETGVGDRTSAAQPTARAATTGSTTVPPTTVPPTTVPPTTVPGPASGITVGPLDRGTGPIPVVHRVPTFDPVVFITIDDGVTPEPEALELLRSRNVPVTLFLTRNYIGRNIAYFQGFQAAGDAIGSHTMNHVDLRGKDEALQQREVCGPHDPFAQWFGGAPVLFRPPYGTYDDTTLRVAAACGITTVVHWTSTMADGVLSTQDGALLPGEVILLHFKPGLAVNLSVLLDQIAAAGLRPAQLADYISAAPAA